MPASSHGTWSCSAVHLRHQRLYFYDAHVGSSAADRRGDIVIGSARRHGQGGHARWTAPWPRPHGQLLSALIPTKGSWRAGSLHGLSRGSFRRSRCRLCPGAECRSSRTGRGCSSVKAMMAGEQYSTGSRIRATALDGQDGRHRPAGKEPEILTQDYTTKLKVVRPTSDAPRRGQGRYRKSCRLGLHQGRRPAITD